MNVQKIYTKSQGLVPENGISSLFNSAFLQKPRFSKRQLTLVDAYENGAATTTTSTPPPSTQARTPPPPPSSYRVSFFDAMKFNGPVPEKLNGRLAMISLLYLAYKEHITGLSAETLLQPDNASWRWAVVTVLIIYATMVPALKGVKNEDFGFFSVNAEKVNGRAAMMGFAVLLGLEIAAGGAPFF
jgi:hypothetical protein